MAREPVTRVCKRDYAAIPRSIRVAAIWREIEELEMAVGCTEKTVEYNGYVIQRLNRGEWNIGFPFGMIQATEPTLEKAKAWVDRRIQYDRIFPKRY